MSVSAVRPASVTRIPPTSSGRRGAAPTPAPSLRRDTVQLSTAGLAKAATAHVDHDHDGD